MRKRSSKGGGAQRSIQVHLMVNEEEAAMIRAAARKRNQTVSLTIIEAVKLLEGSLYVEEDSGLTGSYEGGWYPSGPWFSHGSSSSPPFCAIPRSAPRRRGPGGSSSCHRWF